MNNQADREKRIVAAGSVAAAVLLTSMKVVVGAMTGSLGILSEAAHSALDLVAAVVTLFAVRVSSRPPDQDHSYGHGKVENLSALFETLLLLATCVWIIYEAVERLFFRPARVEATVWAFVIMAISIVVDLSRSRALLRVAHKYQSQALEADALHFSTDVWSSLVVIGGLGAVLAAHWFGIPWLEKADAAAAIGVAGIVVWVSVRLGKKTVSDLLDAAPPELRQAITQAALVPGVLSVERVRLRRSGPETFADVTLAVSRGAGLETAHDIATTAENSIRRAVPGTDVTVHVEPARDENEALRATILLLAARHGMGAHAIRVYEREGLTWVELHLEIVENLSIREAHDQASAFERALHEAEPSVDRIVTHLEPTPGPVEAGCAPPDEAGPILEYLRQHGERDGRLRPHDVHVQRAGTELSVSFHCTAEPDLPLALTHTLAEKLEADLRQHVPHLSRVMIHVEPPHDEDPQPQERTGSA